MVSYSKQGPPRTIVVSATSIFALFCLFSFWSSGRQNNILDTYTHSNLLEDTPVDLYHNNPLDTWRTYWLPGKQNEGTPLDTWNNYFTPSQLSQFQLFNTWKNYMAPGQIIEVNPLDSWKNYLAPDGHLFDTWKNYLVPGNGDESRSLDTWRNYLAPAKLLSSNPFTTWMNYWFSESLEQYIERIVPIELQKYSQISKKSDIRQLFMLKYLHRHC